MHGSVVEDFSQTATSGSQDPGSRIERREMRECAKSGARTKKREEDG